MNGKIDVAAIGEVLIDFAQESVDALGYPTMAAHPGGISSVPGKEEILALLAAGD